MTWLETFMDDRLYEANRKALNLGLLASCVEMALASRGTLSDAGILDMIEAALDRAKADEAGRGK
jgi:hypothetical protein